MKFSIANAIVRAKVARSLQALDWLAQRYNIERGVQLTKHEAFRLGKARSVVDLRTVEGRVALRYWQAYASVIPECFDFHGRMTRSHQNNASDPVNLALNYAYGVLEGEKGSVIVGSGGQTCGQYGPHIQSLGSDKMFHRSQNRRT